MDKKSISKDRKKYLRKIKLNKIAVLSTQIATVIILIALWEILANVGIIDSFIASQPSRIVKTFLNLSQNNLLEHLGVTCFETIIGFVSGAILGVLVAIILWWSKFLSKVADPFLVVLNSLPKIALGPVIIIWVGARNGSNYLYGISNFTNCNSSRNFKWIFKYRQRTIKNGKNI